MRIPRNPKQYELTNHLGNVLSTVLDRKTPITATGGSGSSTTITHYEGDVVFATDYYPFGSPMSWSTPDSSGGRMYSGGGYRYGFNGQEKDNEIKREGNNYDFGARMYDPSLGRWLSLDPLMTKYPALSPYIFCANNPIIFIDVDGKEFILSTNYTYDGVASPTSAHQLGVTSINGSSPFSLAFNSKTNEFDFTLNVNVQFTSNFTSSGGGSMEKENPGLYSEVKAHENWHVQQIYEAAKKSFSVTINIGGKEITYSGRADQILTKAKNEFEVKLQAQTQSKINNGDFKTQEEVNAYQKVEYENFNNINLKT